MVALKIETTRYDLHARGVEITLQIESGPTRPARPARVASRCHALGHQTPLCQGYLMELFSFNDLDYCKRFKPCLNVPCNAPRGPTKDFP